MLEFISLDPLRTMKKPLPTFKDDSAHAATALQELSLNEIGGDRLTRLDNRVAKQRAKLSKHFVRFDNIHVHKTLVAPFEAMERSISVGLEESSVLASAKAHEQPTLVVPSDQQKRFDRAFGESHKITQWSPNHAVIRLDGTIRNPGQELLHALALRVSHEQPTQAAHIVSEHMTVEEVAELLMKKKSHDLRVLEVPIKYLPNHEEHDERVAKVARLLDFQLGQIRVWHRYAMTHAPSPKAMQRYALLIHDGLEFAERLVTCGPKRVTNLKPIDSDSFTDFIGAEKSANR